MVGELVCPPTEGGAFSLGENGVYNDGPFPMPWDTSFEDCFRGYKREAGFCYADPGARYSEVTSPVRSPPFAAAFEIGLDGEEESRQARCVREGELPEAATYGAWYYIPSGSSDPVNWNLFHFQGGAPREPLPGVWDVNVGQDDDGELALYVANTRSGRNYRQAEPVPLPTDRWFHLEFYLKRAADETGEVALFQDGQELVRASGIVTNTDPFVQWYVGNLALSLTPPQSIVYVDDVSIRPEP